jgi:hypothetical protein
MAAAPAPETAIFTDGGAVLVVVEDRDLHALAQLLLDVEALGRLDVFEVHAAERGLERGDDVDELVGVAFGEFDVEHVDAGELLEEAALAFHHRLAGERADVAEAEHRRAVGDDADEVGARGVFGRERGVFFDREARIGHTGRVGEREIALVHQRLGRHDRDLAAGGRAVVFERRIAKRLFGGGKLGGVLFHAMSPGAGTSILLQHPLDGKRHFVKRAGTLRAAAR